MEALAESLLANYPILFLIVGLPVLYLRLENRSAWLLALLFASMIALAPLVEFEPRIPGPLRGYAAAYKVALNGMSAALFCYFFAVFPAASPLDRRLPWVKTAWLYAALAVSAPPGLWSFFAGGFRPLLEFCTRLRTPWTFGRTQTCSRYATWVRRACLLHARSPVHHDQLIMYRRLWCHR